MRLTIICLILTAVLTAGTALAQSSAEPREADQAQRQWIIQLVELNEKSNTNLKAAVKEMLIAYRTGRLTGRQPYQPDEQLGWTEFARRCRLQDDNDQVAANMSAADRLFTVLGDYGYDICDDADVQVDAASARSLEEMRLKGLDVRLEIGEERVLDKGSSRYRSVFRFVRLIYVDPYQDDIQHRVVTFNYRDLEKALTRRYANPKNQAAQLTFTQMIANGLFSGVVINKGDEKAYNARRAEALKRSQQLKQEEMQNGSE